MNEALAKLDAEIGKQQRLLDGLRLARDIIGGVAFDTGNAASQPVALLEGPKRRKRREESETQIYEVNDVGVEVTSKQFKLLDVLLKAEGEWVKGRALAEAIGLQDSTPAATRFHINLLRDKLKRARARLESSKAHGFRIVTDD